MLRAAAGQPAERRQIGQAGCGPCPTGRRTAPRMVRSLTRIRLATVDDAARLSTLGAATFRDTFEADNKSDDVERYLAEAFTPHRQAEEISDPSGIILLAEHPTAAGADDLIGYAHLVAGAAPEAIRGPAPVELKRLYVDRAWHGKGVARDLMDAAIEAARA